MLYFLTVNIMKRKNLDSVAADEPNGPGLWEFTRESGSDSMKIAYWGLYYIRIRKLNNPTCISFPTEDKEGLSSFNRK